MLRGSMQLDSYLIYRKLICISKDDGSALVWNDNLNMKYYKQTHKNMRKLLK